MREPAIVACSPVAWGPSGVDGSVIRHCNRCMVPIHVSPATLGPVKKKHPHAELLCIPCFGKAVDTMPDGKLEILEEQWNEVIANIRKRQS